MTNEYMEAFNCVQIKLFVLDTWNYWEQIKLLVSDSNTWNFSTVRKQMSYDSFKNNVTYKLFVYKSYT